MAYSKQLIDHYEKPRNVGSMDKEDTSVGTGHVGAPACGDVMKLQIKVDEKGVIGLKAKHWAKQGQSKILQSQQNSLFHP